MREFLKNNWALLLIFTIMSFFTFYTPLAADDYAGGYLKKFLLKQFFINEYAHYLNWGGRSVAGIISQININSDLWIFNLLTPLVFTFMVYFAVYMATCGQHNAYYHMAFFALLWLFIIDFGSSFFWRSGAATYCWTLFFALAFLFQYTKLYLGKSKYDNFWITISMAFLGLLAGWSTENLGIVVFLASAFICILLKINKQSIPKWALFGSFFSLVGWLFLILAPGNYIRFASPDSAVYRSKNILDQTFSFFQFHIGTHLLVFPLAIFVIALLFYYMKKRLFKSYCTLQTAFIYFILAELSLMAFIFSIRPPARALTTSVVLLCISAIALSTLMQKSKKIVLFAIITILLGESVIENIGIFVENAKITEKRLYAVNNANELTFIPYKRTNKYFFVAYSVYDIDCMPSAYTKYYNRNNELTMTIDESIVVTDKLNIVDTNITLLFYDGGILAASGFDTESTRVLTIYYLPDFFTLKEIVRTSVYKVLCYFGVSYDFRKLLRRIELSPWLYFRYGVHNVSQIKAIEYNDTMIYTNYQ